jgi:hypothetical protein
MIEDQDEASSTAGPGVPLPAMGKLLAGAVTDPASQQIWRGRWEDTAAIGVLIAVAAPWVLVAPIGDDPEYAEQNTVIVTDSAVLGFGFTIWPQLAVQVPMAALEVHLGDLPTEVVVKPPLDPEQDQRSATGQQGRYRLAVRERWRLIAERAAEVLPKRPSDATPVRERLEAAGHSYDQLADAIGEEPALAIWRGERAPTAAEGSQIEAATGIAAATLPDAVTPPAAVVELLSHPKYRAGLSRKAERLNTTEGAVHRQIQDSALPTAARHGPVPAGGADSTRHRWAAFIEHELGS